jgi:hypothetical protein
MKIKRISGYSKDVAKMYVPNDEPIYCVSSQLSEQVKWQDGKPTGEIAGYQAWFVAQDTEPFKIKFSKQVKLPAMFTQVKLDDLEACEVGNQVYFRAKDIEAMK